MPRFWCLMMVMIGLGLLAGCREDPPQTERAIRPLDSVNLSDLEIVTGQTVFVPAYSEIFHGQGTRTIKLTVTLAIHNTDADTPIVIQSVRYYDTGGALVRDYVDTPLLLSPLGTTGFVIPENDQSGGFGANFIVEWVAEASVSAPVVEAVMVNTGNQQGLSLISPGTVLSEFDETNGAD